jgi:hypothetical protein
VSLSWLHIIVARVMNSRTYVPTIMIHAYSLPEVQFNFVCPVRFTGGSSEHGESNSVVVNLEDLHHYALMGVDYTM